MKAVAFWIIYAVIVLSLLGCVIALWVLLRGEGVKRYAFTIVVALCWVGVVFVTPAAFLNSERDRHECEDLGGKWVIDHWAGKHIPIRACEIGPP